MTERQSDYLTDNLGDRFVRVYLLGRRARWGAAFLAAQFVGERDGQTKELADRLCKSEDTIEALARAAIMYRGLKAWSLGVGKTKDDWQLFRVISEYRTTLSISHWALAGRLMVSRDMTPDDVFALLQFAAENHKSVEAMRAQVGESENDPPSIPKSIRSLIVRMQDLVERDDSPCWLKKWAAGQAEFLQRASEKYKAV